MNKGRRLNVKQKYKLQFRLNWQLMSDSVFSGMFNVFSKVAFVVENVAVWIKMMKDVAEKFFLSLLPDSRKKLYSNLNCTSSRIRKSAI